MIINVLWFLLAVAGLFVLGATIKGTKSTLWFLLVAGAIFALMGNMVFNSGIEVRDGFEQTEFQEGPNRTTISRDTTYSSYLIDEDRNDWMGMLLYAIAILLILIGVSARFL